MYKIALILISSLSLKAVAADVVFYCGPHTNEGAMIKVEPKKERMCYGAGPVGADYCDRAGAQVLPIVYQELGQAKDATGTPVAATTWIGQADGKVQLVTNYNIGAAPSIAIYSIQWAELKGTWYTLNHGNLSSEAKPGEPVCIHGEEGSF